MCMRRWGVRLAGPWGGYRAGDMQAGRPRGSCCCAHQERGASGPGRLDQGLTGAEWPQGCHARWRRAPCAGGVPGECAAAGPPRSASWGAWQPPPHACPHSTVFSAVGEKKPVPLSVCPSVSSLPHCSLALLCNPHPALRMSEIPKGTGVPTRPAHLSSATSIPRVATPTKPTPPVTRLCD